MGGKPPGRIEPKIFLEEGIRDVIMCFKFGDDRFRGLASAQGQILPFPIDFDGRPYNTLILPCERVIVKRKASIGDLADRPLPSARGSLSVRIAAARRLCELSDPSVRTRRL